VEVVGAGAGDGVDAAAGETTLANIKARGHELQLLDHVELDRLRRGLAAGRAAVGKAEDIVVDRAVDRDVVVAWVAARDGELGVVPVRRKRRKHRVCARHVEEIALDRGQGLERALRDRARDAHLGRGDQRARLADDLDLTGGGFELELNRQVGAFTEADGDVAQGLRPKAGQARRDLIRTARLEVDHPEATHDVSDGAITVAGGRQRRDNCDPGQRFIVGIQDHTGQGSGCHTLGLDEPCPQKSADC